MYIVGEVKQRNIVFSGGVNIRITTRKCVAQSGAGMYNEFFLYMRVYNRYFPRVCLCVEMYVYRGGDTRRGNTMRIIVYKNHITDCAFSAGCAR